MPDFFNRVEAAAWGGFLSTHGRLSKRIEENLRRTAGISHAEYEVLLRLFMADDGRSRIQELATESLLSHSGTSRLVDRLEGAGFVERAEAEEDKRATYAVLTDRGREHFMRVAQQHVALVRQLFLDHLSQDELATLGSYWAKLEGS